MAARKILGLVFIAITLVLIPVAWVSSRAVWFVAFAMFAGEFVLFFSGRVYRCIEVSEKEGSGGLETSGRAMPTDIHNYTDWRSGGRSESMNNSTRAGDRGDA